jgi:sporulation protein YlmC with PRC-barrel domain
MDNFQTDNTTGVNHEAMLANTPLRVLTSSSITGDKIFNLQEEHLGTIKDIMLNIIDGRIEYFIMETGGIFGLGANYFAIPFRLLKVDEVNKRFIYNMSKESITKSPGFDVDHWPETNLHLENLNSYWNFMGE